MPTGAFEDMIKKMQYLEVQNQNLAALVSSLMQQRPNTVDPSPSVDTSPSNETTPTTTSFFQHSNPKFSFPIVVGENGIGWHISQIGKWGGQPPFLDRYNALYTLLKAGYESTAIGAKPTVTLATTTPGFGKTRLLVEWIIQVFLHPFIVASFLAAKQDLDLTIQSTDVEQQIRDALDSRVADTVARAKFLLQLYDAARTPTIITINAVKNRARSKVVGNSTAKITPAKAEKVCTTIMIDAITSRFKSAAAFTSLLQKETLSQLVSRYWNLARESTPWNNFAGAPRPAPLLIFNIDEVQGYTEIITTRNAKNLAFEITNNFLNMVDRESIIVNMVGLKTGDMSALTDTSQFFLVPYLPVDPLLKREYLKQVCKEVLGVQLYPATGANSLPKPLSQQICSLWLTTCGVPRAIEILVAHLRKELPRQEPLSTHVLETISKSLPRSLTLKTLKEHLPGLSAVEWYKLLLDFIFCAPKNAGSEIIPKTKYEDLEAAGVIIPFSFDSPDVRSPYTLVTRNYTLPFFQYSEDILAPMDVVFQGKYDNINNPDGVAFVEHAVKMEQVIKVFGRTVIDEKKKSANDGSAKDGSANNSSPNDNEPRFTGSFVGNNAGHILEVATACSLWLRYLRSIEMNHGQLKAINDILVGIQLPDLYASWNGIICFTKHGLSYNGGRNANFDNYMNFLATNGLIALNVRNSQFGDVVVPLYDKEGKFAKILSIQCRNVVAGSSKVGPKRLFAEATYTLEEPNKAIYMVMSPNIASSATGKPLLLSERLEASNRHNFSETDLDQLKVWENQNRILLTDGKNWLSDWFLRVFLDEIAEEPKTA